MTGTKGLLFTSACAGFRNASIILSRTKKQRTILGNLQIVLKHQQLRNNKTPRVENCCLTACLSSWEVEELAQLCTTMSEPVVQKAVQAGIRDGSEELQVLNVDEKLD
jgi:hypothetical protein